MSKPFSPENSPEKGKLARREVREKLPEVVAAPEAAEEVVAAEAAEESKIEVGQNKRKFEEL